MLDRFSINPTQLTGLLSFTAAAIACLVAAWRSITETRIWYLLAVINGLFAFETIIGLRHRIHDFTNSVLIAQGRYAEREPVQELMVISFATLALTSMVLFRGRQHMEGGAVRVAVAATMGILALFAVETVSLHALDAAFYRPAGPVLAIAWLWVIAAVGIVLSSVSI
jgi:hypothetical protein